MIFACCVGKSFYHTGDRLWGAVWPQFHINIVPLYSRRTAGKQTVFQVSLETSLRSSTWKHVLRSPLEMFYSALTNKATIQSAFSSYSLHASNLMLKPSLTVCGLHSSSSHVLWSWTHDIITRAQIITSVCSVSPFLLLSVYFVTCVFLNLFVLCHFVLMKNKSYVIVSPVPVETAAPTQPVGRRPSISVWCQGRCREIFTVRSQLKNRDYIQDLTVRFLSWYVNAVCDVKGGANKGNQTFICTTNDINTANNPTHSINSFLGFIPWHK